MGTQSWRDDPRLKGRFHPENPDDVQVIVHDGGPRMTDHAVEEMWVRVTGLDGEVFSGTLVNEPRQLSSVELGSEIKFVASGCKRLLRVTDDYIAERSDWKIVPCPNCGLDELMDPPSVLLHKVFPDAPKTGVMEMFTAVCGMCGGTMTVLSKEAVIDDEPAQSEQKKWWQFWKQAAS